MKLSKLGKAAQSCMMLDLAVTEEAEYASVRGATFVLPEELPRMGVVERLAAVLDIPESKRADIYMTTNEWDGAQAVGGIDLRDHAAGELPVREVPLRLVRGGTELTPMLDSEGGLEMVDKSVLAPIEDELKNGEYINWFARRTAGGQRYYAVKDGFYLKAAVLPYRVDREELRQELEQLAAALRR